MVFRGLLKEQSSSVGELSPKNGVILLSTKIMSVNCAVAELSCTIFIRAVPASTSSVHPGTSTNQIQ